MRAIGNGGGNSGNIGGGGDGIGPGALLAPIAIGLTVLVRSWIMPATESSEFKSPEFNEHWYESRSEPHHEEQSKSEPDQESESFSHFLVEQGKEQLKEEAVDSLLNGLFFFTYEDFDKIKTLNRQEFQVRDYNGRMGEAETISLDDLKQLVKSSPYSCFGITMDDKTIIRVRWGFCDSVRERRRIFEF